MDIMGHGHLEMGNSVGIWKIGLLEPCLRLMVELQHTVLAQGLTWLEMCCLGTAATPGTCYSFPLLPALGRTI